MDFEWFMEAIDANARKEERERCAKIGENLSLKMPSAYMYRKGANDTAQQIRNSKEGG